MNPKQGHQAHEPQYCTLGHLLSQLVSPVLHSLALVQTSKVPRYWICVSWNPAPHWPEVVPQPLSASPALGPLPRSTKHPAPLKISSALRKGPNIGHPCRKAKQASPCFPFSQGSPAFETHRGVTEECKVRFYEVLFRENQFGQPHGGFQRPLKGIPRGTTQ